MSPPTSLALESATEAVEKGSLVSQHLRGSNSVSLTRPSLSPGAPVSWWSGPEGLCLCLVGPVLYALTPQIGEEEGRGGERANSWLASPWDG